MTINLISSTIRGISGQLIYIETDIQRGLPAFNIVGLGDTSIKESKERIRSAIINSGFEFPTCRITVNLAPADLKKEGALFDLPIAIAILMASKQIPKVDLSNTLIVGELSLDGSIRQIKGMLPIVLQGINNNYKNFFIPKKNIYECYSLNNISVYPFTTLKSLTDYLVNFDIEPFDLNSLNTKDTFNDDLNSLSHIIGQESSKRAIEVSASGNHNLMLVGPPGAGKTMLAKTLQNLLPPLSYEEALEVTSIYSSCGKLKDFSAFSYKRPFRSPHHSITPTALVGGGHKIAPGEITLSHNGILFLDELLEFKRDVLDLLRQPLEEKVVNITRNSGSISLPSKFLLIAAINPCSCGYYLSNIKDCICTETQRQKYLSKLSGPILDRIDIFSFTKHIEYTDIHNTENMVDTSINLKETILKARNIQRSRFEGLNISTNSEMDNNLINKFCKLDSKTSNLLELAYNKYKFSMRTYYKMLKVSRTIADLKNKKNIDIEDISEAIQYRKFI